MRERISNREDQNILVVVLSHVILLLMKDSILEQLVSSLTDLK